MTTSPKSGLTEQAIGLKGQGEYSKASRDSKSAHTGLLVHDCRVPQASKSSPQITDAPRSRFIQLRQVISTILPSTSLRPILRTSIFISDFQA